MSQLGSAQCGETTLHEPHVWGIDAVWGRVEWECPGLSPDVHTQLGTEEW